MSLHYLVVGEEDYAFDISIDTHGEYHISGGTYTSDRPRSGKLTRDQEQALENAIEALGTPEEHQAPDDAADAFRAKLILGEGKSAMIYPFWQGALQEDSKLLELVRLLEMI
ncbi:MAG: hypothetical protein ABFS23_00615 [Pseudomonadota bacterium]